MATTNKKRSPAAPKRAVKKLTVANASWLRLRAAEFGVLRIALFVFTVFIIAIAPPPGSAPIAEGWALMRTMIAPVFAPLLLMLLLLDALMARVFMAEKIGAERSRFRRIVGTDLLFALLLFLFWLPYFMALGPKVS